jgi:hypothetical protein
MDTLVIQLIKRYKEEVKNTKDEKRKEIIREVINDLEKMVYLYKPSATYHLTEWAKKDKKV